MVSNRAPGQQGLFWGHMMQGRQRLFEPNQGLLIKRRKLARRSERSTSACIASPSDVRYHSVGNSKTTTCKSRKIKGIGHLLLCRNAWDPMRVQTKRCPGFEKLNISFVIEKWDFRHDYLVVGMGFLGQTNLALPFASQGSFSFNGPTWENGWLQRMMGEGNEESTAQNMLPNPKWCLKYRCLCARAFWRPFSA